MKKGRRGTFVVLCSLLAALVLAIAPLPDWLDGLRPMFPLLALWFWATALPDRYGTWTGFLTGLVVDVLRGSPLGLHALVLAVAGFAGSQLSARIKVYPMAQQALVLALVAGTLAVLARLIGNLTGTTTAGLAATLVPVVTTALLWPWTQAFLDRQRRRFNVN